MANTPVFFTSFVATAVSVFRICAETFCLSPSSVAIALAMLLLDMARAAFVAAFMGLLVFGNISTNANPNENGEEMLEVY